MTKLTVLRAVYIAYGTISIVSAVVVAARAWHRPAARALALFFACAGLSVAGGIANTKSFLGYSPTIEIALRVVGAFGLAAIVRFAALFPDGASTDRAAATVTWSAAAVLAVAFATGLVPFNLAIAMLCVLASSCFVVFYLRSTYARADAGQRREILWIVMGVAVGAVLIAVDVALIAAYLLFDVELRVWAWDSWLFIIGLFIGSLMLQAAVFYRGAIDPALLIRRTMLVGVLGPVLIFVFAGIENVAANYLAGWLHFDPRYAGWLAGGTIAVTFGPLRNRFDSLIARLFSHH
ncbi:MAG TPA: hypothetical protein VM100_02920 [Longimicrobiales bacterium]|nr:hypothetical protein [Longimicrobiales bacterium]